MGSPWAGGVLRNSPLISPTYVICYMAHGSFPQFLKKFQKKISSFLKDPPLVFYRWCLKKNSRKKFWQLL